MSATTTTKPRQAWGAATPDIGAIATQALALIDADGLQALTVRSLAERMGANHGNLYRRFATRDALLDCVAMRIVSEADLESIDGSGKTWAFEAGHRLRTAWLAHPFACSLISLGGHTTAVLVDRLVQEFLTLRLEPRQRVVLIQSYLAFLVGWILISAQDGPASTAIHGSDSLVGLESLQRLQAEVASLGDERAGLGDVAFTQGLAQVLGSPALAKVAR